MIMAKIFEHLLERSETIRSIVKFTLSFGEFVRMTEQALIGLTELSTALLDEIEQQREQLDWIACLCEHIIKNDPKLYSAMMKEAPKDVKGMN
jgi:hypothetical protein